MAVSLTVTVSQYAGNNSNSTPYPTGFAFKEASWLRVYLTGLDGTATLLESGTHYTVTGAGDDDGGDVTTLAAYDNRYKITIARVTPATQLLDLEYNDRLPAELVEDAFDKLTFLVQELVNDRPLKFPKYEPADNDTELPAPIERKGCVLGFDADNGESVLFEMPLPVVNVIPPSSGTHILGAVDGVMQWVPTVNCA